MVNQRIAALEESSCVVSGESLASYTRKYPRLFSSFNLDAFLKSKSYRDEATGDQNSVLSKSSSTTSLRFTLRTNIFMSRFIEDCYDSAYASCNTVISTDRWRKHNGLDLNGYDAFPLIVERYLERTYSVLRVRQQILMEVVITLEHILNTGEKYKFHGISDAEMARLASTASIPPHTSSEALISFHGQKALLFSQFLSEESDCDVVALYLCKRAIVQNSLMKLRIRDLYAPRVWTNNDNIDAAPSVGKIDKANRRGDSQVVLSKTIVGSARAKHLMNDKQLLSRTHQARPTKGPKASTNHTTLHSTDDTLVREAGPTVSDLSGQRTKVVPVKLPAGWHYLHDVTMPETPLLAFEVSLLAHVLFCLLPKSTLELRKYFALRATEFAQACVFKTDSDFEANTVAEHSDWQTALLNIRTEAHAMANKRAVAAADKRKRTQLIHIPLCLVLSVLCSEFKAVPLSVKSDLLEGNSLADSLTTLSTFYENDQKVTKDTEASIVSTVNEVGIVQSQLLLAEKQLRRLTRRWESNTASDDDLKSMEECTIQVNEHKLKLMELESSLSRLKKRQKQQQRSINDLWEKAISHDSAKAFTSKQPGSGASIMSSGTGNKFKAVKPRVKHITAVPWVDTVSALFTQVLEMNRTQYLEQKAQYAAHAAAATTSPVDKLESNDNKVTLALAQTPMVMVPSGGSGEPVAALMDDGNMTTAGYRFIVGVMSKITANNAIREGKRRVALSVYLKRQEHALLLQYGGEKYLAAERERQRKLAYEQERTRYLEAVKVAAKREAPFMMDGVMEAAIWNARVKLFDPWSLLTLNPTTWLAKSVIDRVEYLFAVSKEKEILRVKRRLFKAISRDYRIKSMRRRREHKMCSIVIREFVRHVYEVRNMNKIVSRIQKAIRTSLWRGRYNAYVSAQETSQRRGEHCYMQKLRETATAGLKHWREWARLERLYKLCQFNQKDRRFIVTFYTWLDQYKKHKIRRLQFDKASIIACLVIQCATRCLLARCCVRRRIANFKVNRAIRTYHARQVAILRLLQYRRRLADYCEHLTIRQDYYNQATAFKLWRKSCYKLLVLTRLVRVCSATKAKRSFKFWKAYYEHKKRVLLNSVVKVQSVFRMVLAQRFILNYYRFSRGIKKFQARVRRYQCIRRYVVDIYYYRKAKSIQRLYRGYYCRSHLYQARITDIHYAASHNNYDRLQHYINNYPELLTELDYVGNTALHNAAKTASKRTMKQLLRFKMNPNAINVSGYSALHLLIMSPAIKRDDCFLYMIERGFDIDQITPDGKTTLLLAVTHNRWSIIQALIKEGIDTNTPDFNGLTCLQSACQQGNYLMAKELIDNEADVNAVGQGGTYPLHDVTASGNLDIAHLLFRHGAYVNVADNVYYQTPLMWACKQQGENNEAIVRLYILQGANVNARDSVNKTAVHYAAIGDSVGIYNALREADCEFDAIDSQGDTPLHLAAECGSSNYAISLLHGGVYCSGQNRAGDQPAHIAAKYNQLELLRLISLYDEHMGRVNYAHQTPLGVAKFYRSKECIAFLEENYRLVETRDTRNVVTGELWWDKSIDEMTGDWEVQVNAQAERVFFNRRTGQLSHQPPNVSLAVLSKTAQTAELPLKRNIVLVKEENKLNKHAYYAEFAEKEAEVADLQVDYRNATVITKFARRKLAYLMLIRLRIQKKHSKALNQFMRMHMPGYRRWKFLIKTAKAVRIQRVFRGHRSRKEYFAPAGYDKWGDPTIGLYWIQRKALAHRRLRYDMWDMWQRYKRSQDMRELILANKLPVTLEEWHNVVQKAGKPMRCVGMYEEYRYPKTRNILFYRHATTGSCYLQKPAKMRYLDEFAEQEVKEIKRYGATMRQIKLVIKLQSLYRGYKVRSYSKLVERAMTISLSAETKYLNNPEQDNNLYNYALHCLVIMQDMDRARRVYVECLRRMQYRGPDIPFVLYSYVVFAMVSHDEDYLDIVILLERAKKAEQDREVFIRQKAGEPPPPSIADGTFIYGKVFILAKTGFFYHAAVTSHNAYAWECYAVCNFLVYNDFNGSFDAFMEAFKYDKQQNKKLQANFDIMMTHFHGPDKRVHDAVVKERVRHQARLASDAMEHRRQARETTALRNTAAKKIQRFYANRKGVRVFNAFMSSVRQSLKTKLAKRGNISLM